MKARIVNGKIIKFFAAGEYGEEFERAHYHVLLFGHDFKDRIVHTISHGLPVYKSVELQKIWSLENKPIGHAYTGTLTFESAQ